MIKVGLVGEDPNDTLSIKNLLEKRYSQRVQFIQLVRGIKAYNLDAGKIKRTLPIEFADKKCKWIVFIRDLDALKSNIEELDKRIKWFKELDALVKNKGILLLNIWELEALILGDITTFNKEYKINYRFTGNPTTQKEPKEILKRKTFHSYKQFKESHCPDIFKLLDIDLVEKNCSCFKDFIDEFDKKIA